MSHQLASSEILASLLILMIKVCESLILEVMAKTEIQLRGYVMMATAMMEMAVALLVLLKLAMLALLVTILQPHCEAKNAGMELCKFQLVATEMMTISTTTMGAAQHAQSKLGGPAHLVTL